MNYYIVGFSSRGSRDSCGSALVYASTNEAAMRKVRDAGWVPNPGDRYLLGSSRQAPEIAGDVEPWMLDEAREEGMAIIWSFQQ